MYKEIDSLLAKSKNNDIKSKEILLLKLKPLIISSIKRYYNRLEIYDDLIQEGYEIILLAIDDYNSHRKVYFLGYIKTLLKYHYLDKHKEKQFSSINKVIDDKGTEIIDLIPNNEKEFLEIILDKERNNDLIEALSSLTSRQRQITLDFYINRLSILKIADNLDISYRTVVNTKTRALNKLKNTMVK